MLWGSYRDVRGSCSRVTKLDIRSLEHDAYENVPISLRTACEPPKRDPRFVETFW